jgi:hypothetical protein
MENKNYKLLNREKLERLFNPVPDIAGWTKSIIDSDSFGTITLEFLCDIPENDTTKHIEDYTYNFYVWLDVSTKTAYDLTFIDRINETIQWLIDNKAIKEI